MSVCLVDLVNGIISRVISLHHFNHQAPEDDPLVIVKPVHTSLFLVNVVAGLNPAMANSYSFNNIFSDFGLRQNLTFSLLKVPVEIKGEVASDGLVTIVEVKLEYLLSDIVAGNAAI